MDLLARMDELKKEFERNRETQKELDRRQLVIEYELQALKTLARDLLAHGIENIEI